MLLDCSEQLRTHDSISCQVNVAEGAVEDGESGRLDGSGTLFENVEETAEEERRQMRVGVVEVFDHTLVPLEGFLGKCTSAVE